MTHRSRSTPARTIHRPWGILAFMLLSGALGLPLAYGTAWAEAQTIGRVKLVLDGYTYLWEAGTSAPQRAEGQFQDPGLVLHLAGFQPGQLWETDALLMKVAQAQRLLADTRIYNDARVLVVPSRKEVGRCTILIQITTGFSLRFGGGGAWGMAGDDNADGAALGWRLWGGYNRAGGLIGQGLQGLSEAWWQAGMVYTNNGLEDPAQDSWQHEAAIDARLGTADYPLYAELDLSARSLWSGADQDWTFMLHPTLGVDYTLDLNFTDPEGAVIAPRDDVNMAAELGLWGAFVLPEDQFHGGLEGQLQLKARTGILTLASQLCGAWSPTAGQNPLPDRLATDWRNTEDRSVRGDYSKEWLLLDHALLWSTELRLSLLEFPLGFINPVGVETFVFFDTLAGGRRTATSPDAPWFDRSSSAFGPGLRLLLGSPVNTDFTLALGMNPDIFTTPAPADPPLRLIFTVSAGF